MKRIAFVVSWFYKTFTPTTILVAIFHICTCDDVTLFNEKSIVSWKYMKSDKKCVFNVNLQYNHKQVATAYFSMMFNIHRHISHLIFVLVPECGEHEICNQKIILLILISSKIELVIVVVFTKLKIMILAFHITLTNIFYLALLQSELPMNNCIINVNLIYI